MAKLGDALRDTGVSTSLLLTEQASNPSTPASGFGRLYAKADGLYFIDDAGAVTGPLGTGGGGGGGGGLLAVKQHNPDPAVTYARSNTAFADVDAPNAAVTFTAPASGKVVIRATAAVNISVNTAAHYWNLRDAGGDVAGTPAYVSGQVEIGYATVVWHITGLTSGNPYTYKLGFATSSGHTATIFAGNTTGGTQYGPLVLEVLEAP